MVNCIWCQKLTRKKFVKKLKIWCRTISTTTYKKVHIVFILAQHHGGKASKMTVLKLFLLVLVTQTGVILLKHLSFCCQPGWTHRGKRRVSVWHTAAAPWTPRLSAASTSTCNCIQKANFEHLGKLCCRYDSRLFCPTHAPLSCQNKMLNINLEVGFKHWILNTQDGD